MSGRVEVAGVLAAAAPLGVPSGKTVADGDALMRGNMHMRDLWVLGVVHAKVGQIVTFFAYRPPSRPQGSLTPAQPGRVTNPTQGHPGPPWVAPQAECWSLRREPKPPA